ncbi:SAM-dependent methyltransferase [Amycolatopsis benzoatilytica]|uniref:SAM-dependent methyltransferase n=1 Tax=Amycolatopsis benzoatilytica TaxID=346045 RepID=UPI000368D048|nr:SAM-dependent methyltransferase [Amycolatopsis benzoatilytica]
MAEDPLPGVDLERPNVARVYDWYLGGTANWAVDREFGKRVLATFPAGMYCARANRAFLHRAVRHLVARGVRQFVDIGSGVPTMGNVHQVADEVAPDSRVVYIDCEPVAVAHSRILLERHGDPARHAVIQGDLREPDGIWAAVAETGVVDLAEPVALLVTAVLHIQQAGPDGEDIGPAAIAQYRELLVPGSYLVLSQITHEGLPADLAGQLHATIQLYDDNVNKHVLRSKAEFGALFGDFELLAPGVVWTASWRPEESGPNTPAVDFDDPSEAVMLAGVGRKR